MSISPIMQKLAEKLQRTDLPDFAPGDTVRVQVKIKEGDKERLQAFEGMVIACRTRAKGAAAVSIRPPSTSSASSARKAGAAGASPARRANRPSLLGAGVLPAAAVPRFPPPPTPVPSASG